MSAQVQIIEKDGEPEYAVVPIELYRELLEKAEMLEDVAAYDRAREALDEGGEETVPSDVVDRLLSGEHPVKVWRTRRGLTQAQLAEAAGVTQGYIAQLEKGQRKGGVRLYRRLARALQVNLDDLTDWLPEMESSRESPGNDATAGE